MQRTTGFDALIGANRGCYAAFAAVYECAVPVVAAVNGFCLGGGIGLVGNADVIVASDDATFGLPEVDRGALGRGDASRPARARPPDARDGLHLEDGDGAAAARVRLGAEGRAARASCAAAAHEVAGEIAAKDPYIIRLAKESLNGIDPIDVKRSYRFEQGFTFEINLSGRADEHRDAFVAQPAARNTEEQENEVSDKRMSIADVVGRLESGMTIGIGGWGSRRKPMAIVRAIANSPLTDLTLVSYGGPDVGLLDRCRQGAAARQRVRLARFHRAGAAFRGCPPARRGRVLRGRRGHAAVGPARRGAAAAVPADPGRPRLRRHAGQPAAEDGHLALRRTARSSSRCRRSRSTRRSST